MMKSDHNIKAMVKHMALLRSYDDDISISLRLDMINELNKQIKNILMCRHSEKQKQAVRER